MTVTDARVTITYMSRELVRRTFRLEPYQLVAPEWSSEQSFDIQATIPAGGTRAQVPEMLQAPGGTIPGLVVIVEVSPVRTGRSRRNGPG
jgi:hypothetical protein